MTCDHICHIPGAQPIPDGRPCPVCGGPGCCAPPKCVTCEDNGVIMVRTPGEPQPDANGTFDGTEIPCPMCTDTWADRDDYEQSLADHHRELENEE